MKKIVHIGLGKAASTTLQKHVFPAFSKSRQTKYLDVGSLSNLMDDPGKISALPDGFLASSEALIGPHTQWEQYRKRILEVFGSDATILIVLRKPSGYLQSVFQQVSHQNGVLVDPKSFFTDVDSLGSGLYAPHSFDQERLIKLYADTFREVICQKLETISDLEFIRVAFALSEVEMITARSNMAKRFSNRSFSRTAVSISRKLKWIFGTPSIDLATGAISRTRRYQLWRDLMQGIFDKVFPYKKFVMEWDGIPNVDIHEMDAAYDKMPRFQHFIDGKLQPAQAEVLDGWVA